MNAEDKQRLADIIAWSEAGQPLRAEDATFLLHAIGDLVLELHLAQAERDDAFRQAAIATTYGDAQVAQLGTLLRALEPTPENLSDIRDRLVAQAIRETWWSGDSDLTDKGLRCVLHAVRAKGTEQPRRAEVRR